jgi:hypothetical protein
LRSCFFNIFFYSRKNTELLRGEDKLEAIYSIDYEAGLLEKPARVHKYRMIAGLRMRKTRVKNWRKPTLMITK